MKKYPIIVVIVCFSWDAKLNRVITVKAKFNQLRKDHSHIPQFTPPTSRTQQVWPETGNPFTRLTNRDI